MTVQTLAIELLRDFGITTLTPADSADNVSTRGPSTGDLQAIINALNEANIEIWGEAPSNLFRKNFGYYLHAPTTVSVAVTQFSTAATITTWSGWMEGCTIRISGDSADNEIAYQNVLVRPYMGGTGTTSAVVYADCIPFTDAVVTGSDVIGSVFAPVRLPGYGDLSHCADRQTFLQECGLVDVVTPHTRPAGFLQSNTFNKQIATPSSYFVDTSNRQNEAYTMYLRVNPMPSLAVPITWEASLGPPTWTTADIDNGDHATDPNTSIYLPFPLMYLKRVARRIIAADGRFNNLSGKELIVQHAEEAVASLGDLRPDTKSGNAQNPNNSFRGTNRGRRLFR